MLKSMSAGYVMVNRDTGSILDFTFSRYRRDAIQEIQQIYANTERRELLKEYRCERSVRSIETAEYHP